MTLVVASRVKSIVCFSDSFPCSDQTTSLARRDGWQPWGLSVEQKSGESLLRAACWDVVRRHHLPSLEQAENLASNLRNEARQAHEDDRESRMTMWKNWLRTDYRAACNWCKNADCEKIVIVQQEDGTQPTQSRCTHSLNRPGFQSSRCTSLARDPPGNILRRFLVITFPSPANALLMCWMVKS